MSKLKPQIDMKENLEKEHSNIFDHIPEYALVREFLNDRYTYSLYHKSTMNYVHVESDKEELIELLISKGIQVAESVEEVKPKDFKSKPPLTWDELNGGWKQLSQEEFELFLKERAEKRHRK
jgi:hypothetical protein